MKVKHKDSVWTPDVWGCGVDNNKEYDNTQPLLQEEKAVIEPMTWCDDDGIWRWGWGKEGSRL